MKNELKYLDIMARGCQVRLKGFGFQDSSVYKVKPGELQRKIKLYFKLSNVVF